MANWSTTPTTVASRALPVCKTSCRFFPAIDLNVSPKWEINFGVGIGPTAATDHWIVKGILGRHFDWPARNK